MARTKYVIEEDGARTAIRFDKVTGLVPVITQEHGSNLVLMNAFANREALEMTLRNGYAHYYSRSRGELWEKGATSGNRQLIIDILIDCDGDSILYIVDQEGTGACHTGAYSCFFRRLRMPLEHS